MLMYTRINMCACPWSPLVVNGEEIGEDGEERGEVSLKAQQEQLEAEKQAIMQNKELLEGVSGIVYSIFES